MRWRAIVIGLAISPLFLRGELLPIRTYTIVDGLAADNVYGIAADSRGFLWFSTSEGLSRITTLRRRPAQIVSALWSSCDLAQCWPRRGQACSNGLTLPDFGGGSCR